MLAIAYYFLFPRYLGFGTDLLITILFALSLDLALGYAVSRHSAMRPSSAPAPMWLAIFANHRDLDRADHGSCVGGAGCIDRAAQGYTAWDNVFSGNRHNLRLWLGGFKSRLREALTAQVRASSRARA